MNSKKDDEINNVLSQDKYITESNQNTINNYIKSEDIKPKKISQSLKSFIIFAIIILLIVLAILLYIIETKDNTDLVVNPIIEEDSISLVDKTFNVTSEENIYKTTDDSFELEEDDDESDKANIDFSSEDLAKLKDFLNYYAYATNRFTTTNNNPLEKNTIYIYMAMKYFDAKAVKSSSLDTLNTTNNKYLKTLNNVSDFLADLTGYTYNEVIETYQDYVTYSSYSNAYDYGQKSLMIEQYTCNDVKISANDNGLYTAIANITRIAGEKEISYEVSITFEKNEQYTYVPFKIYSIDAKNLTETFDTTFHLIDLYDLTSDDYENSKDTIVSYMNQKKINNMQDADYCITINSIQDLGNSYYQFNITASYVDAEEEKIEQNYAVTMARERGILAVKYLENAL